MSPSTLNQNICRIEPGLAGLTEMHLEAAYIEAAKQAVSLREALLKLGVVTESELLKTTAQKTGLEFSDLDNIVLEQQVLNTIGANTATHYNIVPLKTVDHELWVATCDPFNQELKTELELVLDTKYDIRFILATSESIKKMIRKSYGIGADTVEQMVTTEGIADTDVADSNSIDENKAEKASVIKLVNQILTDAVNAEATDIHFEPYEDDLRVRYRTDGVLHNAGIPPSVKHFIDGIRSRIKIMSGLDIAEKRLPQDGRAQITISAQQYDLRTSILPAKYGEAVNIRILPRGTLISDLCSLGITTKDAKELNKLIFKPHGIILVTGPTGSGKTTTLYTCMKLLNRTDKKIITIEDPIEYDMSGPVQMQVRPEIGFTFAKALRSMLRHDPDVMLIGEIRDLETAETAIRTALTGHLVFSTLHTNSAASTLTRLLDMGIEPYLAASSIEGILGQRLIRIICRDCKESHEPEPEIATAIKSLSGLERLPSVYHGRGCRKCRFTGYHGRTVITELLVMSEKIRNLTINRRHANEIDIQARKEGMVSLFTSGMEKVHRGLTTYEEILRVTKGTVVLD